MTKFKSSNLSGSGDGDDILEVRVRSAYDDYFKKKVPANNHRRLVELIVDLREKCGIDLIGAWSKERGRKSVGGDDWW